jgi:perosamine synthetase
MTHDMEEAAVDALRNDKFLRGENVLKFEEEFARKIGTRYAISTGSGTTALQFIFLALHLEGKKVVTTPMSFIATANTVLQANATPVFGDMSNEDYCLDALEAEAKLREGASAMLPVHLFGHPANFSSFEEVSEQHGGVPIVEDACQAHGARYKGKTVGSLGVAAAFSFYPSKNMSVLGDGGMVTTSDETLAKYVAKIRDGGRLSWYEHDLIGYSSRLSSVHCAIGRIQLKHLDEWNARRKQIASLYHKNLSSITSISLPPMAHDGIEPVFHQFVLRCSERDQLKENLAERGIETGIHYPVPIHLQPIYLKLFGFRKGDYPRSENFANECLSLPMHPLLTDDDVGYVCESIRAFFSGRR